MSPRVVHTYLRAPVESWGAGVRSYFHEGFLRVDQSSRVRDDAPLVVGHCGGWAVLSDFYVRFCSPFHALPLAGLIGTDGNLVIEMLFLGTTDHAFCLPFSHAAESNADAQPLAWL